MPVYEIESIAPVFTDLRSNWIGPDATLVGDVRVGRYAASGSAP